MTDCSTWRRRVAKRDRNSGRGYVSLSNGKNVKEKIFRKVTGCCGKRCFEMVCEDQVDYFKSFWAIGNKLHQDAVLMSYMKRKDVLFQKEKRPNVRNNVWSYSINVRNKERSICRQFLLSLLQISEMRFRTVQNSLLAGGVHEDRRGKHKNRPNKIVDNIWQLVEEHWKQITDKETHDSTEKSVKEYYGNPDLNVTKLYSDFKQFFLEKTGNPLKMSYSAYLKYFRENCECPFQQSVLDRCKYLTESEASFAANPGCDCKDDVHVNEEALCSREEADENAAGCAENGTKCAVNADFFDVGERTSEVVNVKMELYEEDSQCSPDDISVEEMKVEELCLMQEIKEEAAGDCLQEPEYVTEDGTLTEVEDLCLKQEIKEENGEVCLQAPELVTVDGTLTEVEGVILKQEIKEENSGVCLQEPEHVTVDGTLNEEWCDPCVMNDPLASR